LIGAYPEGDSPEGIESLAGFPGEWVLDWTAENSEIDDVTNPMRPSEGTFRTVKGSGGTCFVDMPIPPPMWSTGGSEPDSTVGSTGFRCVKPLGSAGDSSPTEPQVHEGNH
jgi:formylglycine-generating enzyme required for sulfatase activity